jgi:hypothetical protein
LLFRGCGGLGPGAPQCHLIVLALARLDAPLDILPDWLVADGTAVLEALPVRLEWGLAGWLMVAHGRSLG